MKPLAKILEYLRSVKIPTNCVADGFIQTTDGANVLAETDD